jgi:hypothetical protein
MQVDEPLVVPGISRANVRSMRPIHGTTLYDANNAAAVPDFPVRRNLSEDGSLGEGGYTLNKSKATRQIVSFQAIC